MLGRFPKFYHRWVLMACLSWLKWDHQDQTWAARLAHQRSNHWATRRLFHVLVSPDQFQKHVFSPNYWTRGIGELKNSQIFLFPKWLGGQGLERLSKMSQYRQLLLILGWSRSRQPQIFYSQRVSVSTTYKFRVSKSLGLNNFQFQFWDENCCSVGPQQVLKIRYKAVFFSLDPFLVYIENIWIKYVCLLNTPHTPY